jgi:hypothetical protein
MFPKSCFKVNEARSSLTQMCFLCKGHLFQKHHNSASIDNKISSIKIGSPLLELYECITIVIDDLHVLQTNWIVFRNNLNIASMNNLDRPV